MNIVVGGRGSGKTSVLISKLLDDEDAVLLVQSTKHRELIAKSFPAIADRVQTFDYLFSGEFRGYFDYPKSIYIDELDTFLANVFSRYGVGGARPTASLTPESIGTPTWGINEIWRGE